MTTTFPKLLDKSKRQRVVEAIKNCIASGILKPGQRLIETNLSNQMNVGTPTVREALIDLEHQGFVTRIPNRGTFVTKLTQEEVGQIYSVREVLEGFAVRLGRRKASEADVQAVRAHLEAMQRATDPIDRNAFYEADLAFHRAIWTLSKNQYLVKTLEFLVAPLLADIMTRYPANNNMEPLSKESLCEVVRWHEQILSCLTPKMSDEEVGQVIHKVLEAFQRSDSKMYGAEGGAEQEGTEGSPLLISDKGVHGSSMG